MLTVPFPRYKVAVGKAILNLQKGQFRVGGGERPCYVGASNSAPQEHCDDQYCVGGVKRWRMKLQRSGDMLRMCRRGKVTAHQRQRARLDQV